MAAFEYGGEDVAFGLLGDLGDAQRVRVDVLGDGVLDDAARRTAGRMASTSTDSPRNVAARVSVRLVGRVGSCHSVIWALGDGQALEVQPVLYVAEPLGGEPVTLLGEVAPGVDAAGVVVAELVDVHLAGRAHTDCAQDQANDSDA